MIANFENKIKSVKGVPPEFFSKINDGKDYKISEIKTENFINTVSFIIDELESFKILPQNKNFAISDLGRILNIKTQVFVISNNVKSIEYVTLNIDEKNSETCILSNLVINLFNPIKNPENFNIHHLNGNRSDNRLSNLTWLSLDEYNHKDQILGDLKTEIWKDLAEYPEYQISSLGRLERKDTNLYLKYYINGVDFRVGVRKDNKNYGISVSKYICLTFFSVKNDPDKRVFHKNENIFDNNIENLEYTCRNPYSVKHKEKLCEEMKTSNLDKDIKISSDDLEDNDLFEEIENIDLTDYSDEKWLPISEFEDLHVSSFGRVKNSNGIRKQGIDGAGYRSIHATKDGKRSKYQVHQLILRAFNPVENMNNLEVNHKDHNPTNNKLDNLEWVTSSENAIHGWSNKSKKTTARTIIRTDPKTGEEKIYPSTAEASRELKVFPSTIRKALKGHIELSVGFKWRYESVPNNKIEDNLIPGERWKRIYINNEESNYLISDYGRIFNGDILKKNSFHKGYAQTCLSHKNNPITFQIHLLVAHYFLGPKPISDKMIVVHHIDENPLNNHFTNLKYITQSENVIASRGNGNTLALKKKFNVQ